MGWRRGVFRDPFFVIPLLVFIGGLSERVRGAVSVTGPTNITAQVGANIFMKCSVMGTETLPLLRWRLSGTEYTPSTLPDRFISNSTGLLIYSVTHDDNGLMVQCYIVLFDPSSGFITVNSPVGVITVWEHNKTVDPTVQKGSPPPSPPPSTLPLSLRHIPASINKLTTSSTTNNIIVTTNVITTSTLGLILPLQPTTGTNKSADNLHVLLISTVAAGAVVFLIIVCVMLVSLTLVFLAKKHKRKKIIYCERNSAYDFIEIRQRRQQAESITDPQVITTDLNICYETVFHGRQV